METTENPPTFTTKGPAHLCSPVPARLTNNILSTAQQVYLKQGGGAKSSLKELSDEGFIDPGKARRTSVAELSPPPRTKGDVIDTTAAPRESSAGEKFRKLKEEEEKRKAERRRVAEAAQAKKDAARKEAEAARKAAEAQAQVSGTPRFGQRTEGF
jgi:hypothetical protein